MVVGTGTLLNVPATTALEPYIITANHVIPDVTTAQNADIVWDCRSTKCDSNDSLQLSQLPHSTGTALLHTDSSLDASLIQVNEVPVGKYGRAYLGWDTRAPVVGDNVIVMHHPLGTHMRISYGQITAVEQSPHVAGHADPYAHQTKVTYSQGVTEGGSSGSSYLYVDSTYRIGGMLSNGRNQVCGAAPDYNFDNFASFSQFYNALSPEILTGATGDSAYTTATGPHCFGGSTGQRSQEHAGGDVALLLVTALTLLAVPGRRRMATANA
jgi:hypothetical protein